MPLDLFICGDCQSSFNEIDQFMTHKRDGCSPPQAHQPQPEQGDTEMAVTMTEINPESLQQSADNLVSEISVLHPTEAILTNSISDDGQQTVIILQEVTPELISHEAAIETPRISPVKRRGRPKKGEERNPKVPPPPKEPEKAPVPEIGKDGKYHCVRCKRAFGKERFFVTHKCLASSDYVDITKKEIVKIDSGDEDDEMEEEEARMKEEEDDVEYAAPVDRDADKTAVHEGIENVQVSADPDTDSTHVEKETDKIDDIPVFKCEEEKVAFEHNLNVDLSGVDHMFRVHVIEQDLNDNIPSISRQSTNSLSLYSCNVCEKVFKTLSHMRLHCLIHTDLKPFKCPQCDYCSNSKGNLYTHMRKHTGQFYKCARCDFKTVNKSHLLEHEATHSNMRYECEICQKDYNTVKSLINHIRKYHNANKRGKEYLQKFLTGRQSRGTTVIHQCHVCNRKFKKKIDRDRHLFVHDIKDIPNIQHCELCEYTASRKLYLQKHYQKHRIIYRCAECPEKFLSSVRLIDHVTSAHIGEDNADKWEQLFEQCINNSVYLPEPDETLDEGEKELVNLPLELSSTSLKNKEVVQSGINCIISAAAAQQGDLLSAVPEKVELASVTREETPMDVDASPAVASVPEASLPSGVISEPADVVMTSTPMLKQEPVSVPVNGQLPQTTELSNQPEDQASGDKSDNLNVASIDESNIGDKDSAPNEEQDLEDEEEEHEDDEEEEEEADDAKLADFIVRLGYRPMSMRIFHKMRETFGSEECEFCGRLFYNKTDYEPHVRTHTGDKPFVCTICGYRAITKDNLKRHTEKDHENATYACMECDFVANSRTQLWNHQMKHRGLLGLECPECKEKFENMKGLRSHAIVHHPNVNKQELQKVTGYKHRMQGKMGRRSYKCPYCDRVFIRANSELQKHIWIHEGIKPYKCPLCTHACRSKNNLQAHMLRHSAEKPFMCTECGKAYKSKTALRWHVRSHKDGKLFKCDKCPYEATQQSHLKRHMETHDVVKRFVCQHCDYSANTLGYMKIHYTRNHKGLIYTNNPQVEKTSLPVDAKVYKCLSCDYLFGNLSDLKRHLRVRHHVQVQDMQALENSTVSEVQVLQYTEEGLPSATIHEEVASTTEIETLQNTVVESELDEKTASAVNILQQIIDMSQQGAFGQQHFTVQGEDGQTLSVNPETIIVQQEEEVLLADGSSGIGGNQYVIQYVTPQEIHTEGVPLVEVQTGSGSTPE